MQVIRARLKSNRFFEFANHWSTGTLEIFCILERLPQRSDSKRSTERIRWSCWRATRRGHGRRRRRVVTTTTTDRTDWQRQSSTSVHCLEDRGSPADNHVSRSASTPPSADECASDSPCSWMKAQNPTTDHQCYSPLSTTCRLADYRLCSSVFIHRNNTEIQQPFLLLSRPATSGLILYL